MLGLLLALLAVPLPARAQATTGTISGTVTDESKAVLPGVTVLVTNTETGATRTLVTDERGGFRALNLTPGLYSVTADLQGFTTARRENLTLQIGRDVAADLVLKVGALSEQVTVQGAATNIELSSTVAGGVVSATQIAELPLNGRSFMQLATLQPGVTVSRATARDFTGGYGNTQVSIGGARPEMTGYLLEGTNIADVSDKAPSSMAGVLLGVDAVKEFSVQTHDYAAEFGRAAGGVISAVTKSGTNNLHGTLFEFLRDSKFDEPNYFDPIDAATGRQVNPPFTRNQFGGTAGGPIAENKLFYFGSYEGLRQNLSLTHLARLPNAAAHNGVLPTGTVAISPLVKPYLDLLYPIPDGRDFGDGTAELRHTDIDPTNENFFVGKVDWQASNSNSMFVRFSSDRSDSKAYQEHPLFIEPTTTDTRYFTYQDQHLFSSRVLNVARAAINRTNRTDDFIPTITIPQNLLFTVDPHFGAITITTGISTPGTTATTPVDYTQTLFQYSDTLTLSSSRHTAKMGVDFQRYHFDGFSYSRYGGEFRFTSLQNFLRGTVNRFTGNMPGTDTQRSMRQNYVATFIQDEWRPAGNLTVNYGLRYEFFTVPYETRGRVAGLLSFNDLESGPQGVTPGTDMFRNPSKLDFAPRVGIAWNPFGDQRTSVKVGAGLFYHDVSHLPVLRGRRHPDRADLRAGHPAAAGAGHRPRGAEAIRIHRLRREAALHDAVPRQRPARDRQRRRRRDRLRRIARLQSAVLQRSERRAGAVQRRRRALAGGARRHPSVPVVGAHPHAHQRRAILVQRHDGGREPALRERAAVPGVVYARQLARHLVGRFDRRLRLRERRRQRDELFPSRERGRPLELRRPPHVRIQRRLHAAVRQEHGRAGTAGRPGLAGRRRRELRERRPVHAVHRLRLCERSVERPEPPEARLGARFQRRERNRRLARELVQRERVRPAACRRVRQRRPQHAARSRPEARGFVGLQEHDGRQAEHPGPAGDLQSVQPREFRDAEFVRPVQPRRHADSGRDANYAHLDDVPAGAARAEICFLRLMSVEC
jgi:hypothetical protein